jgi:hypothetical protein
MEKKILLNTTLASSFNKVRRLPVGGGEASFTPSSFLIGEQINRQDSPVALSDNITLVLIAGRQYATNSCLHYFTAN